MADRFIKNFAKPLLNEKGVEVLVGGPAVRRDLPLASAPCFFFEHEMLFFRAPGIP